MWRSKTILQHSPPTFGNQPNPGLILEIEPANLLPHSETFGFHRWKTGEWSSCSATCGVGLMTRTVACTHRPFADSNRTVILGEEDCHPPKPSPVQACNRFDCPPLWDLHPWGQVDWLKLEVPYSLKSSIIFMSSVLCSAPRVVAVGCRGGACCANSGWRMAASLSCPTPSVPPGGLWASSNVVKRTVLLTGSLLTGLR